VYRFRSTAGPVLALAVLAATPACPGTAAAADAEPTTAPDLSAPIESSHGPDATAPVRPPTAEEYRALDERLNSVEKKLALIQRKFRLLASENEAEALGGELFENPRWLFEAALQEESTIDGLERAYRYFALVAQLHPDSPEAKKSFLYAARIHRYLYRVHRVDDPHSIWVTSEPAFMIQWLSTFFEPGVFPDTEINVLAWKLPLGFYDQLQAYAKTHPEMRKWRLVVEEDNGKIEKITGVAITP
jgi:hypothetical protein